MIRPLSNKIIFQFLSELVGELGLFKEKTESGIIVSSNFNDSGKNPRWGVVMAIGSEVNQDDIKVGTFILIEPLMWSDKIKIGGESVWQTDETKIMAVSDEIPSVGY